MTTTDLHLDETFSQRTNGAYFLGVILGSNHFKSSRRVHFRHWYITHGHAMAESFRRLRESKPRKGPTPAFKRKVAKSIESHASSVVRLMERVCGIAEESLRVVQQPRMVAVDLALAEVAAAEAKWQWKLTEKRLTGILGLTDDSINHHGDAFDAITEQFGETIRANRESGCRGGEAATPMWAHPDFRSFADKKGEKFEVLHERMPLLGVRRKDCLPSDKVQSWYDLYSVPEGETADDYDSLAAQVGAWLPGNEEPRDRFLNGLAAYLSQRSSKDLHFTDGWNYWLDTVWHTRSIHVEPLGRASANYCRHLSTPAQERLEVAPVKPKKKRTAGSLSTREKAIRQGIRDGLKGIRYCSRLEEEGIKPRPEWITRDCPATYPKAYKTVSWRQNIQDEKSKTKQRMDDG